MLRYDAPLLVICAVGTVPLLVWLVRTDGGGDAEATNDDRHPSELSDEAAMTAAAPDTVSSPVN